MVGDGTMVAAAILFVEDWSGRGEELRASSETESDSFGGPNTVGVSDAVAVLLGLKVTPDGSTMTVVETVTTLPAWTPVRLLS